MKAVETQHAASALAAGVADLPLCEQDIIVADGGSVDSVRHLEIIFQPYVWILRFQVLVYEQFERQVRYLNAIDRDGLYAYVALPVLGRSSSCYFYFVYSAEH